MQPVRHNMNVVVWTKPKCFYCTQAKELLESMNLEYQEKRVGESYTVEQFREAAPQATTYPQIFIYGNLIGGFSDLVDYIEQTGYNGSGYTL